MKSKIVALSAFAFVLAACAQPEPEPQIVYVQPSYDKVGQASCPGGYALTTDDAGETACAPI